MRLTAKTVPAGETFMTRFPEFTQSIEEVSSDGKFDEAKARQALKGWQEAGFLMWGDDPKGVIAFAVEFLHQLATVTRAIDGDLSTDAHTKPTDEADKRLERRMARGRHAYTRFDITGRAGEILVRVSCANPKEIPGTAMASARRFAVFACRILNHITRQITEQNQQVRIRLEGVGDLADVFAEADWIESRMRERDAVDAANAERVKCARRLGEYCSPSDPACRCYCGGKCVEAKLGEEWESFRKSLIRGRSDGKSGNGEPEAVRNV